MSKAKKLLLAVCAVVAGTAGAADRPIAEDAGVAPWFKDAKFGIFIHWGIYAVNGMGGESWPFFRGKIAYEDYMKQTNAFTAAKYDPKAWADLFKEAGARYAVLTTKHHDGVALWDTKQRSGGKYLSMPKQTPAGRDLIGPFVDALRADGLKVGLYFSHLDWSHPDYRAFPSASPEKFNRFRDSSDGKKHPERWERFLAFHRGQLKELCEGYKPDLLWFDGDWERNGAQWRFAELRKELKAWDPGVILNSRMGGYGDYPTPEQGIPVVSPGDAWELCMTIDSTWSYRPNRSPKKTSQLIRVLSECVSMGGNLLLNVGPDAEGVVPPEQVAALKEIGAWLKKYGEAVYGTVPGPARIHYGAPSTLSKDRKTLYLFVFDKPVNQLVFKGLKSKIKKVSLLNDGRALKAEAVGGAAWSGVPPVYFLTVPDDVDVGYGFVVKMELEEPIELYVGKSGAIESN